MRIVSLGSILSPYSDSDRDDLIFAVQSAGDGGTDGGGDTTPPTATITTPASGALVRGTQSVAVSASDNVGVARVELLVDGTLNATLTAAPYTFSLSTTTLTNGAHALVAKAYDAAGNTGLSSTVSITVDNAAPSVAITAPAPGATVTGTTTVTASASDSIDGITSVSFLLDGTVKTTVTTSPYTWAWNTTTATAGAHTLAATALDPAGNQATSANVAVTVNNPTAVEIDCGGAAVAPFVADEDFAGGGTIHHTNKIDLSAVVNPAPMTVYQTGRIDNFTYTIPGFAAGSSHTVRLHFAETYFSTVGARVFNVILNGTKVLTNFDIYKTAGAENKALVESFTANATTGGAYTIQFTSVVNNSLISAIEIR